MPGSDDDWSPLTPGLDDLPELMPGWGDGLDLGEPTDRGGTTTDGPDEDPWWVRFGIGIM
jgi:hypothetical protein